MVFISGTDRYQMSFDDMFSFDNLIAEDNYVRVIDAFVDTLDLKQLGFVRKSTEKRNGVINNYKIYSCFSCLGCKYIDKCTKSIDGRTIKRNIKEDSLMKFDFEYKKDSKFYKLRKELVEHPFGTIKYALGLNHVYIRGMERMSAWAASVFLAYDLKRVINILGTKQIIAKLEALKSN